MWMRGGIELWPRLWEVGGKRGVFIGLRCVCRRRVGRCGGGRVEKIALADGRDLEVMDLSLVRDVEVAKGDRRKLYANYFYWFVGSGVTTPHHWSRVFLTSLDRITKNLNHRWAYVIVMSVVTEGFMPLGKNETQTVEMLKQFTAEAAPSFMRASTPGLAP